MGKIHLKGMEFKSHIGVYDFEQQYGNNFLVDVVVESDRVEGNTDNIEDTLDYTEIYQIVSDVMHQRGNLIEHAAKKILERLKEEKLSGDYTSVSISKIHPPLGASVQNVSVVLEWNRKDSQGV